MASLPDDVILEIFSHLPARSAARLRAMSRSWRAALSSPSFVDLHLQRANCRTAPPKLFCGPCDDKLMLGDWCLYDLQPGGGGGPGRELVRGGEFGDVLPAPLTKPLRGLVLFTCYGKNGVYVCNPSTGGEALALPDTEMPSKAAFRPSLGPTGPPYYWNVAYGLGYCSAAKEFKVVRIFSEGRYKEMATRCEVFVLDSPAYWRPAAGKPPPPACIVENTGVFLNGSVHFLCRDGGGIVSFNVTDESFGSLPSPPPAAAVDGVADWQIRERMTELDGCLCVFQYASGSDSHGPCHLWLLRHGGDETAQWEKLCCIDPIPWPSCSIVPLCMYGEKILMRTGRSVVFAVDGAGSGGAPEILFRPDEHEATAGEFEDTLFPALGLYEESLVPVGRTVEEIVFSSPATRAWSDVLKWLPARTVSELSVVCKEWRAMVTTDRFIRSHAVHANMAARSPRIRFVMDPIGGAPVDIDRADEMHAPNISAVPFVCSQPCHGLNVGSFSNILDFVCNPIMDYHEELPLVDSDDDYSDDDDDIFYGRIALGYDEEEDDHVVVRLAYTENNPETRSYELQCRMRYVKRQEWSPQPTPPPPRPVASATPAYANGKIYWLVDPALGSPPPTTTTTPTPSACELVALDCRNAVACHYAVLQGPPPPPCSAIGRVSVLRLHGTLCVACSDRDANAIDVWAMNGAASATDAAWSMMYRLELAAHSPEYTSEKTTVMAVDPTSGRILLNTEQSLGYYDPKTGELETIYRVRMMNQEANDGSGACYDGRFCAVVCEESLFWYPVWRAYAQ
uniref:F-box domain-containing protein n=1 Tax=Oryza punctata TaxID=4537 RepID=A0A0E0M8Y1_ORYPU